MLAGVGMAATLLADPSFNVGTLSNGLNVGIVKLYFLLDVADTIIDFAYVGLGRVAELVNRNRFILYFRESGVVEGFQGVDAESVNAFFD